jgi:hypothetical protein
MLAVPPRHRWPISSDVVVAGVMYETLMVLAVVRQLSLITLTNGAVPAIDLLGVQAAWGALG